MNKKYKILIADDDVDMVGMLKMRLEEEGFDTLVAYDGVHVIELSQKEAPDLIILDLMMPVGSGHSVLNNLRFNDITRDIPVIILTGMDKPNVEKEKRAMGVEDYIRKPYEAASLVSKIRTILSQKQTRQKK